MAEQQRAVRLDYRPSAAALAVIDAEAAEANCSRVAALARIVERAADGAG